VIARKAAGRTSLDRVRLTFALVAAAGLLLSVLTVLLVLFTPGPGDRPLIALAYALMIGVPIGVGLWTWRTRPGNRFGRLLVAAGFLWFITALAASSNELVYSIGRVGAWLVQPLLFVVMLAFPSGRLTTRLDRGLVLAGWLLIAVF
jgi:hypothetical protein